MTGGAWLATAHGVTKSWTRLSDNTHTHTHTHTHTYTHAHTQMTKYSLAEYQVSLDFQKSK